MEQDRHIECVSDFCGNYKNPGAWADLFERPDGTRYVALGGGWGFYAKNTPSIIEESDTLFRPFLDSCESCEDFAFAKENWS